MLPFSNFSESQLIRERCIRKYPEYQLTIVGITTADESILRFTSVFRNVLWLFLIRPRLQTSDFIGSEHPRPLNFGPPHANIPRHVDRCADSVRDVDDVFNDKNGPPRRHILHSLDNKTSPRRSPNQNNQHGDPQCARLTQLILFWGPSGGSELNECYR